MAEINHLHTYVLLIGTSNFPNDTSIKSIPNINTNLEQLKVCLSDTEIIGIPNENITISFNEGKIQIEKKLRDISSRPPGELSVLFIYCTGHGILSRDDYQLYLPTTSTVRNDLEIDGLGIETIKKYVKRSPAKVKIIILDCCHSGAIIGAMNSMVSTIQAGIKSFEGTYIMTSTAEDTPSLFPEDKPQMPTYFTGKLLETLKEGLDNDNEFCSLREIFNKLEIDLLEAGLPRPQQANINTAEELYFSKNKKFLNRKPLDEVEWQMVQQINSLEEYRQFINKFPLSVFCSQAKQRVNELEEDDLWHRVVTGNTISSFTEYLEDYQNGRFAEEAIKRIELLQIQEQERNSEALRKSLVAGRSTIKAEEKAALLELQYLKNKKRNRIFWNVLSIVVLFPVILIAAVNLGLFGKLPDVKGIEIKLRQTSEIFTEDGELISEIGNTNYGSFKDISPNVINALIASEDPRFYKHAGIDIMKMSKSALLLGYYGGGRTLSQKLAKILLGPAPHNLLTKMIEEIKISCIAIRIEKEFTKEEIVAFYLNTVEFSNNVVGLSNAARTFFNKDPANLRLDEAALLIGMLKGPRYNPLKNPLAAIDIRNKILVQMQEKGFISQIESTRLQALPCLVSYNNSPIIRSGFAVYAQDAVRRQVEKWCADHINPKTKKKYNLWLDGLKIYTSINSRMQWYAEEAVMAHMNTLQQLVKLYDDRSRQNLWDGQEKTLNFYMKESQRWRNEKAEGKSDTEILESFNKKVPMKIFAFNQAREKDTVMSPIDSIRYYKRLLQCGFIAMDPMSGKILAWVGGLGMNTSTIDHNDYSSKHQAGSAISPLLYSMALEESGFTAGTVLENTKQYFPGFGSVPNSTKDCVGSSILFSNGLAQCSPCAAAYIIKQTAPANFAEYLKECGVSTEVEPSPSLANGEFDLSLMELMKAYTIFPTEGFSIQPQLLQRIEDKEGNILTEFSADKKEVLSQNTAYLMTRLLNKVVEISDLKKRMGFTDICGMPGNCSSNKDAWFIGFTPQLLTGIWVGYDSNFMQFPKWDVSAGNMAVPIWEKFYNKSYYDKTTGLDRKTMFVKPDNYREY